ncbi:hypothetical protein DV736_g870, partial [Chaetothyriales sp. CBS 134916]
MDDCVSPFCVGHHDPRRALPVTPQAVHDAHAANYDMLTGPITTSHFHSRVMTLLSSALMDGSPSAALDIAQQRNGSAVVIPPLTPADSSLTPNATISQIIGFTSPWIDLCSLDPVIADVSRQVLKLELSYAAFCGLTYVLIPGPQLAGLIDNEPGLAQYARAILDGLSQAPFIQFHIWLPIMQHPDSDKQEIGDLRQFARPAFQPHESKAPRLDLFGSWEAWDIIRSICKYSSRLFVALDLPKLLPPVTVQSRWYSEPVRLLTLDASIFVKNPKGYPVLSKAHQALITRFIRLRTPPWFLLCNCGPIPQATNGNSLHDIVSPAVFPTPAESSQTRVLKDATPHLSYLRNLQSRQPPLAPIERFGAGYQDFLQAPLQPLAVNLESITYEVFERDPVKYDQYEKAIARALHDWVEQGKPTSNPDGRVVVAVVGAGRGPLVTRALRASDDVGVDIDMWALEKNPNAFVLLQTHNQTIWNQRVNLVKSDMRTWRGPVKEDIGNPIRQTYNKVRDEAAETEAADDTRQPPTTYTLSNDIESIGTSKPIFYKIDILISELLGSFGDNELSPECLDGVQHLLNPVHGISIPASYTAYISPIAAPKLYADINNSMILSIPNAAEIPYVVMLNAIDLISTIPSRATSSPVSDCPKHRHHTTSVPSLPLPVILPTWAFHHPNHTISSATSSSSNAHNTRFSATTFPIPSRAAIHGLAGYFESVLYSGVELSTNPLTMQAKSEDMISWFPIYFPLKQAVFAPDESEALVCMWRKTDGRKVWYEWAVDVYLRVMGRRTRVGGSELHSSEKEGCLM